MKILLVHNHYGTSAPSGEGEVVSAERLLLLEHGHEVLEFTRHSDDIRVRGVGGLVRGALATAWNPWTVRSVRAVLEKARPDIVHVHNTFPLISPSVFYTGAANAARVLTLHNYRLCCPAAVPMREGRVCTQCMDHQTTWPAVKYGCYRDSRLATVPLALNVALHRHLGTWRHKVEAFIALSEFQKDRMSQAGLPRDRIHVKPNFYKGTPNVVPWAEREDRAVFVGRIGAEKGVSDLLEAWISWGHQAPLLLVVGDGPLRQRLEAKVNEVGARNIRFLGQLPVDEAQKLIAHSKLLLLPSRWFEGFPMVLGEAFAFGTPLIVSDLGPLPDLVGRGDSGVVFRAGDSSHLRDVVSGLWNDPTRLERMAAAARKQFEKKYNYTANYEQLLMIYDHAIRMRQRLN